MYMYVSECNNIFLAAFAMREAVFCPHGYVCTHMKFGKSGLDTLAPSFLHAKYVHVHVCTQLRNGTLIVWNGCHDAPSFCSNRVQRTL